MIDTAYGIILILKENDPKFLLLRHVEGHWTFPKGHAEGDETSKEAAFRELTEESGITDIEFIDTPKLLEHYSFKKNDIHYDKTVEYFLAYTSESNVVIQESEISAYLWATYEQALETFVNKEQKETLTKAKEYLSEYESGK